MNVLRCIAIVAAATICACNAVDLSAVRDFAAKTERAKGSFDELADDWLGTCVRRTEYARQTPSDLRLVPNDDAGNGGAGPACVDAANFAPQLKRRDDIVVDYVRALGALAGVGATPSNTGALAKALVDVDVLPKQDKGAFAKLAGDIVSSAVNGEKRDAIGAFAREDEAALSSSIDDLTFISHRYDALLVDESNSLDQMYRDTLRAQTAGGTPNLPEPPAFESRRLELQAVRDDWAARRAALVARHARAAAYRDALATILAANQRLVVSGDRSGAAALATTLKTYVDAFGDDVASLAKPLEH